MSKIVSKILRTLLPIFAIKSSDIQEIRSMNGNDLTLDCLVGQLTTFELRNYDNNMVPIGNAFKYSLTIDSSKKEKSSKDEIESKYEDDMDDIEAFLARSLPRGKDKLPLICFECNEVGHFVEKFPNGRVIEMRRNISSM